MLIRSQTQKILGVDPSLTNTGLVVYDGVHFLDTKAIRTSPKNECIEERIENIWLATVGLISRNNVQMVAIENYAFGRPMQAAVLGEVSGVLKNNLWKIQMPFITVPPTKWKKFLTSKGHATKAEVIVEIRNRGLLTDNDNIADAAGVAMYGWKVLAESEREPDGTIVLRP